MRALVLEGVNQPVALRDVPDKVAGPGEVLVRIAAAALNHRDVWIRQGKYAGLKWPIIVGSDGVGTVAEVGPGVDASWKGRRVVLDPGTQWGDDPRAQGKDYRILGLPEDGTLAEYTKVAAAQLQPCPEHLGDAEAAALPLAGLTAYRAVATQGEVGPGMRVLVTGIGGGVALFALQIALARGAEVHVTSGDPAKLERARALGASEGALYTDPAWAKALKAKAGPGYDVVVDSAGGDGFAALVDLARPGGRIVFFGATLGNPSGVDLRRLFWKQLRLQGTTMGTAAEFAAMVALYAEKKLRPVVDRTFSFAEGEEAFRHMEQGKQFGKIVVVP